ncbi:MAG: hypothetical protein IKG21_13100 [Atopobiaceae bacterium]|nr:hypothetical protein [Atopobiaceae bacterium]
MTRRRRRLGRRELARMSRIARDIEVTSSHGLEGHRMCGRKCRYHSEEMAREVASRRMRQEPRVTLRAYECPYCGGWHLTHRQIACDRAD